MAEHAKMMSPSSAARRIACPGSFVLEAPLPDKSSDASDDGTAMHWVAAECLTSGRDAAAFVGRYIDVHDKGQPMRRVQFDAGMADLAQTYVDQIRACAERGGDLAVEQRVDFSEFVDMPAGTQFGTLDAEIYFDVTNRLEIRDLKSGYHRVEVYRNPQLMLYALGALAKHEMLGNEVETIVLGIHQPKLSDEPQEWECTVPQLMQFAEDARRATKLCQAAQLAHDGIASAAFAETYLNPGDEQCRFCKAAGTCPALRGVAARVTTFAPAVGVAALDDFDIVEAQPAAQAVADSTAALPQASPEILGRLLKVAPLVETWLKAVRAEGERRMLAGQVVPDFKLVQGKRGPRKWTDPEAAEAQLKAMRLKVEEMYDLKVISPTSAEGLTKSGEGSKSAIGPRQWVKLQALITQSPGSPSVAPASDKRPALLIAPAADDFEVVQGGVEALV